MVLNSRTLELMGCVINLELDINSRPSTPQSNGLVERKNRTLIDMVRSMLSEYNMSQSFWAEAINTACYCSNLLYCHPLKEKTPYELLNGRKPNIAYFRVFGCKCYILKKGTRLGKFDKNVMKDSYLVIPPQAKHIEFGIWLVVLLRKFMMLNLMKPRVHKKEMRT